MEKLKIPEDFSISNAATAIKTAAFLFRAHRQEKGLKIIQSVSKKLLDFGYLNHDTYSGAIQEVYNTEFEHREIILKKLLEPFLEKEQILIGANANIITKLSRNGKNKRVIIDFIHDLVPVMKNMIIDGNDCLHNAIKDACRNIYESIAKLSDADFPHNDEKNRC
jgi:hypothetical protein